MKSKLENKNKKQLINLITKSGSKFDADSGSILNAGSQSVMTAPRGNDWQAEQYRHSLRMIQITQLNASMKMLPVTREGRRR